MIWAVVLVALAGFGVLVYWNKKLHEKHMREIELWHDAHQKQLETQAVLLEKAQRPWGAEDKEAVETTGQDLLELLDQEWLQSDESEVAFDDDLLIPIGGTEE